MIVLTQLVYVRAGKENEFQEFEATVLPLLERHRGELLLRLRPDPTSWIAGSLDCPYEVHVVCFEDEEGLAAYSNDDTRQRVVTMKDASVERSLVYKALT